MNREEAMETFNLLDTNKDGNLTVKEISLLFGQDTKGMDLKFDMASSKHFSALEHFVEKTVQYVSVDQQQMTFPDFLILMSQRRSDGTRDTDELIVGLGENGVDEDKITCLHPVRDLFKSYDIQRNGVIDANEMKGEFLSGTSSQKTFYRVDVGAWQVSDR